MEILRIILTVIFVLDCIGLTVIVLSVAMPFILSSIVVFPLKQELLHLAKSKSIRGLEMGGW